MADGEIIANRQLDSIPFIPVPRCWVGLLSKDGKMKGKGAKASLP